MSNRWTMSHQMSQTYMQVSCSISLEAFAVPPQCPHGISHRDRLRIYPRAASSRNKISGFPTTPACCIASFSSAEEAYWRALSRRSHLNRATSLLEPFSCAESGTTFRSFAYAGHQRNRRQTSRLRSPARRVEPTCMPFSCFSHSGEYLGTVIEE
jgi:hypothetical protein